MFKYKAKITIKKKYINVLEQTDKCNFIFETWGAYRAMTTYKNIHDNSETEKSMMNKCQINVRNLTVSRHKPKRT